MCELLRVPKQQSGPQPVCRPPRNRQRRHLASGGAVWRSHRRRILIYANYWHSDNTSVATLLNRTLHTAAVGSTTGAASALLQATHPVPKCPMQLMGGVQPVAVP